MTAQENSPPNTAGGLAVDTDEAPPSNDPTQGRARSNLSNLVEALAYEPDEVVAVCHQDTQGGERGRFTHQHVPATADAIWDEASRWVDTSDLWWSVNSVSPPKGYAGRGTAAHVTRWVALFVDLDVKPGGLPSFEAAEAVIQDLTGLLGHEPAAVIESGHGRQALWGFDTEDPATAAATAVGGDEDRLADARAYLRRFGRLAALVAERHGGHVDTIFDPARLLRLPGTYNRKPDPVTGQPGAVETGAYFPEHASPISITELEDVLTAYLVVEEPGDRDTPGAVRSDPGGWAWAQTSCPYAMSVIKGGWGTDQPRRGGGGRHPALVGKATRLAVMHRNSCLSEVLYAEAVQTLSRRFTELCEQGIGGDVRKVKPGEIADALSWGRVKAASKTEASIKRELGKHVPHPRPSAPTDSSAGGGETDPSDTRTPLQRLLDQLRLWVDGDLGQFVFAAAIATSAADTEGEPVWGDVVGPSSGAKTEAIRTVEKIATDTIDDITVAGLLSWHRQGKVGWPTGALARIGDNPVAGLLSIGDLSTLLTDDRRSSADASTVFAALRRIYDGKYVREHGGTPVPLRWQGRLTLLAAVTNSIDNYAAFSGQLGDRFLYYRVREIPAHQRRASRDRPQESLQMRRRRAAELQTAAVQDARRRLPEVPELSPELLDAVDAAAELLRIGRGKVPRDSYGRREIIAEPEVEDPYRLRAQMTTLARALTALQLTEDEVEAFIHRVAIDTVPRTRAKVLAVLADGMHYSVKAVSEATGGIDRRVVRRTLEDLRALGLAICPTADGYEDESTEAGLYTPRDWQLSQNHFEQHAAHIFVAQNAAGGGPRKRT